MSIEFSIPSDLAEYRLRWEEITAGTVFFDAVADGVRRRDISAIQEICKDLSGWSEWFGYLEERNPVITFKKPKDDNGLRVEDVDRFQQQRVRASALALAAQHAIKWPERFRTRGPIDWLAPELLADEQGGGLGTFFSQPSSAEWTWIATRTLLGEQAQAIAEPIVIWNEKTAVTKAARRGRGEHGPDVEEGVLATLELEVLDDGVGHVSQHPRDLFSVAMFHETFITSLRHAWAAAQQLYQEHEPDYRLHDARWRLVGQLDGLPVEGPSASGAAARGFYLALRKKFEDESLIVFAAVDPDRPLQLSGVGRVFEKARAVVRAGRFDTIVVASAEDAADARRALAGVHGIRVKDLSDEPSDIANQPRALPLISR